MTGRVAIVTDDAGWHGLQLRRAFAARGYAASYVCLTDCRFDSLNRHGLVMPGFERRLPEAVFVRGIAGGTLEQVVLRLDFLHCLRELGVPVYNTGRAVERAVDKSMTSFLLARAGIPTPPTWTLESPAKARALLMREVAAGRQLVLKPLFGSQGKGLMKLASVADLPDAASCDGVYYLQRYVDTGEGNWHDWRVLVAGGRAIAAMQRRGKSWINNVAQGASCHAAPAQGDLARLAIDAARVLDMDYAGVDIVRGADGRLQVIEVNSIPAWKGLQSVHGESIAQLLVDDLISRHMRRPMEAAC